MRAIASSAASIRLSPCPAWNWRRALVLELCGGEASEIAVAGALPEARRADRFPLFGSRAPDRRDLDPAKWPASLEKLGFAVAAQPGNADHIQVRAPSWRPDIEGKADLVEEIIRLAGLDRITPTPLERDGAMSGPVLTLLQSRVRAARRALASRGMVEAVTWSFISKPQAELFGGGAPELALANPIAADLSDMRPSLLPGLIAAAKANFARGFGDVALFEVGQVFKTDAEDGQFIAAAGLRRGTAKPAGAGRHWDDKAAPVDVFDVKADLFALLSVLGVAAQCGAARARRPGLSASRPFGDAAIRPEKHCRLVRRIASARAGGF